MGRFRTEHYKIISAKIKEPVRIVFVSDVHDTVYEPDNEPVVEAVRQNHPDAVLIGGDLIVANPSIRKGRAGDDSWKTEAVSLVRRFSAEFPVYIADGNHEVTIREEAGAMYDSLMRDYREAGAVLLHNERTCFRGMDLWGYSHAYEHYEKFVRSPLTLPEMREDLGEPDRERFQLVLAHNPKFFPVYAAWGADLVLAGHIHGGIIRIGGRGLFSPDYRMFPRYSAGLVKENDAEMIVSRGLGTHTIRLRINDPAELSVAEFAPPG